MNSDKQKLLNLIHTGDSSNIILAFKIASSQNLDLQIDLEGYRRILSRDREDEAKDYISANDLVDLFNREKLTLFCNLNETKIPEELQYFTGIKDLYLSGCSHYSFPEFIFNFPKLENLTISWFNMEFIPNEISNLKNLQQLRISYCNVKSFPDELFGLKNLFSIDFSGNKMINLPERIGALKRLRFLELSNNPLHKLPKSFYSLELVSLGIHDTHLNTDELLLLLQSSKSENIVFTFNQPIKWLYIKFRFYYAKLFSK